MPSDTDRRPATPRIWLIALGTISVAATASAVTSILVGGWTVDVSLGFLVLWCGFTLALSERDRR
jgi:hypothetical protein